MFVSWMNSLLGYFHLSLSYSTPGIIFEVISYTVGFRVSVLEWHVVKSCLLQHNTTAALKYYAMRLSYLIIICFTHSRESVILENTQNMNIISYSLNRIMYFYSYTHFVFRLNLEYIKSQKNNDSFNCYHV